MDRLQRIYKLHQAVSSRRHPISCQTLQDELECSRATVNRIIQEMRLYFNAPLEYDRERGGYFYETKDSKAFELPGVWFNAAVLRFTPQRARWVAEEQWHPQQQGRMLEDGSYELRIP